MAASVHQLHFLVVPLMSQSHLIPMTDFAKLVAQRGATVTVVTTPLNAARYGPVVDRAARGGLRIRLLPLRFPCREVGLPDGCENVDTLTSPDMIELFFKASLLLQQPLESLVADLRPRPSCIVTSNALPWTADVAQKFGIPRYVFNAISCFTLLCSHKISLARNENPESETIVVPEIPHRIEFKKWQRPESSKKSSSKLDGIFAKIKEAQLSAQGVLVNSFEEMELGYAQEYKKVANNTWCIGPVSLCNKDKSDKFDRGNKASIDHHFCLKWLDSMKLDTVLYVCFGSLCHIPPSQLKEIALGLEASKRPFIWIIREADYSYEIAQWLEEENFEERIKDRGLVIRGWAPQVLILSHPAVNGFLTHCGWNSTSEGICAGVPMITWPMFAEQFYNEKFITQVLEIGVRIGAEDGMQWGEEKGDGVVVKREQVKKAIDLLMDEGEEGERRRRRAREVGEKAQRAVEEGGSSHMNLTLLIQDVMKHANCHKDSSKHAATHLSHSCGLLLDDPYPLRSQVA